MSGHSFTFSHALCRKPAKSIVDGLRATYLGTPDPAAFTADHEKYVAALRATGAVVDVLEPLEDFPDSVFIEDAALCLKGVAICLRPGADTRRAETAALRPDLVRLFGRVIDLQTDGFVDGGDILCSDDEVIIGLSERTTAQGVRDLQPIVEELGYRLRIFETPKGILHFKSDSSLLDAETILSTKRLNVSGCFSSYKVIELAEGEEAAANAIRFNDTVFMDESFPKTADLLCGHGYKVEPLSVAQAAKVDGGLSCMSLRYSADA